MTPMERTPMIETSGIPRNCTLAGDDRYISLRLNGKIMAATPTIAMTMTPHMTPIDNRVKNDDEKVDHVMMSATMAMTRMMAGTGECVRSLTSESFSGRTRSKAHAKTVRTGMKQFPTMAGRFQNTNEIPISELTSGFLVTMPAKRLKYGATGRRYLDGAAVDR